MICQSQALAGDSTHILMINSYHQSLAWEQDLFSGLQKELQPEKNHIDLHVENMDTKRIPYTEDYRDKLLAVYLHKYKHLKIKLIIVSDNNAFDFIRQYRDALFPGIPVVFCGVNFFQDQLLDGLSGFTGIAETVDAKTTLEIALLLHPKTRNVLIINDYLPTGKAWTNTLQKDLAAYAGKLNISYADDLPMGILLETLRNLSDDYIVIYGVFFRDQLNRFYSPQESTSLITRASPVPVYGLLDFYLGHGIIGGNLISGHFQGKAAGLIAKKILSGIPPENIPVLRNRSNQYMFDYEQLVRWQINEKKLPLESIIINRPFSFYREYTTFVWQVAFFFAIMGIVIIALSINIRRRNLAEQNLKRLHITLEQKVKNRTRELHKAMAFAEQTSQKLMVLSAEMQSILDNSPIGIVFVTQDRLIRRVNHEVVKISGFGYDELIGGNTRRFHLTEQAYEAFGNTAYPVLMNQDTYETDIQFKKKDGSLIWCHMRGRLISEQDVTKGVIWIIENISQRMAAEKEKLAFVKELEQARRYKSLNVMAGAIAHHYNNIMMAVQGNIELLQLLLPDDSDSHSLVSNALSSAKKASQISRSMLTYVGQGNLDRQITDLSTLILETEELLRNTIRGTTDMTICLDSSPLFCFIDPAQIKEVLLNLILNADESIEAANGRISIRTFPSSAHGIDHATPFRSSEFQKDDYVCCEISDNGSGIDIEIADKILEPFFSTKFTGRGLGLSVVAGIIKAHNGTMEIKSTPKKGTRISMLIPGALVQPPAKTISHSKKADKKIPKFSGNIILADDDLQVRTIGQRLLEKLGFNVLLASDGQEAIDLFKENRETIQLIILDVTMPNKNGITALEELRQMEPSLKIILSSGYGQDQIGLGKIKDPPDAFIQKPFEFKDLIDILTAVLKDNLSK